MIQFRSAMHKVFPFAPPDRSMWMWFSVAIALALTACGGPSSQSPTQTPLVIIVTGETPVVGSTAATIEDVLPTPYICQGEIVEQAFEHGRMFWVNKSLEGRCSVEQDFTPGNGEIWVAIFDENGRGGQWLIFEDDWDPIIDPETGVDVIPPEGLQQPARGFGKVWREQLSAAQRDAIGWATTQEILLVTEYRFEARGFVDDEGQYVARPGLHVLVSFGGERFFFDEPSLTFDYIPAD